MFFRHHLLYLAMSYVHFKKKIEPLPISFPPLHPNISPPYTQIFPPLNQILPPLNYFFFPFFLALSRTNQLTFSDKKLLITKILKQKLHSFSLDTWRTLISLSTHTRRYTHSLSLSRSKLLSLSLFLSFSHTLETPKSSLSLSVKPPKLSLTHSNRNWNRFVRRSKIEGSKLKLVRFVIGAHG